MKKATFSAYFKLGTFHLALNHPYRVDNLFYLMFIIIIIIITENNNNNSTKNMFTKKMK